MCVLSLDMCCMGIVHIIALRLAYSMVHKSTNCRDSTSKSTPLFLDHFFLQNTRVVRVTTFEHPADG